MKTPLSSDSDITPSSGGSSQGDSTSSSTALAPLKRSEIIGYAVGDLGMNLNFQMIGFFLAYFYTDVFGISPAHVAGLFLAARIWDAINDPLMGYITDHTETKWGRFRPYLLWGAIPLNLILVACFFTPDISMTGKIIYAYVTYLLHGMAYTAVGLPYSSISSVMTQDQQERSVISSYRMFFAVVVGLGTISIGARPFVALFDSEREGFFYVAIVFGIISSCLLLYTFSKSKERVVVEREDYGFSDVFKIVLKNKNLMVLAGAMLLNTGVWVIGNAVSLYYFKYVLNNENLIPIFFGVMLPCNIFGAWVAPKITKRFGKRNAFIYASVGVAVFSILRFFVPLDMLAVIFGLSMFSTVSQMVCAVTQWAMLPDTIEYGHWRMGIRSEGIPYSFFSFTQKSGMALAGSFAALVLSFAGYEANTELSESASNAILWLFNIWPGICSALCAVVLMMYQLSEKRYSQILSDLSENRFFEGNK